MKIVIGCDVDPVLPRDPTRRVDGDIWDSLEQIPELLSRLGADLPPITWLIRADDSVRELSGDYASGYVSRRGLWDGLRERGHELGWHMHVLTWRAGRGLIIDPEPAWLAAAHEALSRHFEIVSTRTGWDYGSDFLFGELDRLGVRLDFSALPGNRVWVAVGDRRLVVDWIDTPEHAYRPSTADYRGANGRSLDLTELPVTQFSQSLPGVMKRWVWRLRNGCFRVAGLSKKTRTLTTPWDALPARSDVWTFYFHPEDLEGEGMRHFLDNLARLRELPGVEFVTGAEWLSTHEASIEAR